MPGSYPSSPDSPPPAKGPEIAAFAVTASAASAAATGPGRDRLFETRGIVRRIALFVLIAVIVVALVATLPGVGDVRDRLRGADMRWIAVVGGVSVGSVLAYVAALLGAFDRLIPWRRGLALGLAE
ncbi:MAG: hypothetical protein H0V81_17810, partial [Solirubrobacterales bacterium]|nr:hypothetical protein [Solirubrobacterales bacterium]